MKISLTFKIGIIIFTILLVVVVANSRHDQRHVQNINVWVDNQYENYFVDNEDVIKMINDFSDGSILGRTLGSLDLSYLERALETHQYIEDAQVYKDIKGNLSVIIKQNRPIARVLNPNGDDLYISYQGEILPESSSFTARVMTVKMEDMNWMGEYSLLDAKGGEAFFDLLKFIIDDDFWRYQIAGIRVDNKNEITLEPQVSRQMIIFGKAERIAFKFRKLKTFYKKILPHKGWNNYEFVNLKYKNQIVCK